MPDRAKIASQEYQREAIIQSCWLSKGLVWTAEADPVAPQELPRRPAVDTDAAWTALWLEC
jgi:hypothetical protein